MSTLKENHGLRNDILLVIVPGGLPEEWARRVSNRYKGLQIRYSNPMDEDGSAKDATEIPTEMWAGVTILCTFAPPPAELISSVRFVQLTSAGSDRWQGHLTYQNRNIPFCTSNGIHP